jgi:hypothetical protein
MNVRTLCVLSLCSACAGAGGSSKAGHLDPKWVAESADRQGVMKAEIYTDASGDVEKLELYHHDDHGMPEAVLHLMQEKFPGSKVENYETEVIASGEMIYEAEVTTAEGKRCEISATAEGHLRYTECNIPPSELPPAVAQSVAEHVPGGAVAEAEKRQGDGPDQLRIEAKKGDSVHYLIFDAASGQLKQHYIKVPAELSVPAR